MIATNRLRLFSIYATVFIMVGVFLFVVLYDVELDLPLLDKGKRPDFSFEGVLLSQFDDGRLVWEIYSDFADIYKKRDRVLLQKMKGNVFEGDSPVISFSAPKGSMTLSSSDVVLEKAHSKIFLKDSWFYLDSNHLTWFVNKQLLKGEGDVYIRSDRMALSGHFFELDMLTNKLKVSQHAVAEIYSLD